MSAKRSCAVSSTTSSFWIASLSNSPKRERRIFRPSCDYGVEMIFQESQWPAFYIVTKSQLFDPRSGVQNRNPGSLQWISPSGKYQKIIVSPNNTRITIKREEKPLQRIRRVRPSSQGQWKMLVSLKVFSVEILHIEVQRPRIVSDGKQILVAIDTSNHRGCFFDSFDSAKQAVFADKTKRGGDIYRVLAKGHAGNELSGLQEKCPDPGILLVM
ncbi:hypothetical protein OGATHE_003350 [Ogataea polymorpha]|uniref:Uncharacterized protein n=1 Tax=Ogataea polymorpha TaxID=460523 RepID=A0A9P8T3Z9_9ASCO|nr:hypothetical protein OGATHE_003350 [Ogataea polymorpha]